MKYGTARGVYFAAGIFLTLWGVGCLLVPNTRNAEHAPGDVLKAAPEEHRWQETKPGVAP